MTDFASKFTTAVRDAVERDDDRYTEVTYSDAFTIHVQGHPDGGDAFELSIIAVHKELAFDDNVENQTLADLGGRRTKALFNDLDRLLNEVAGVTFDSAYLVEVVDDGTWEKDASMYSTEKLIPTKEV